MKALITGASTGIGRDMARNLHARGAELILVARSTQKLEELKGELGGKPRIISLDLSAPENCYKLYEMTKDENIDILINNAGFGAYAGAKFFKAVFRKHSPGACKASTDG